MANKRIAVLAGTMLRPGVSKNGRYYSPDAIGKGVKRMQERLATGKAWEMAIHSSHGAAYKDDALSTVGILKEVSQDKTGAARFKIDVPNTSAGRDFATLAVPDESGDAYIKGVSIRGRWLGDVKTTDIDGVEATTSDDMDILGFDATRSPGVEGAEIDAGWMEESANDASLFFESLDEIQVFVEEVEEPESFSETAVALAKAIVDEANKEPYGSVTYADPGYQKDGVKRYPLDSKSHAKAAWSYINMPKNAAKYSSEHLASIKAKIKAACKRYGIDIQGESNALTDAITSALEAYASVSFDNGAGTVTLTGQTDDAGKLSAVGARLAQAAQLALAAMDPDNDGDIDIDMNGKKDSSSESATEATIKGNPIDDMSGNTSDDTANQTNAQITMCNLCGANLPIEAKYCPTCGQPVTTAESKESAPTQTQEAQVAEETATEASTKESETESTATETSTTPVGLSEADKADIAARIAEALKPAPVVEETTVTEAKTYTAEEVAEMVKAQVAEQVKAVTEEVTKQAVDMIRESGTSTRKGLVENETTTTDLTETTTSGVVGFDEATRQLAELSQRNRRAADSLIYESLKSDPFFGGRLERLDQTVARQYA